METMAIIDFETTGLAPKDGARATEIAAVIVQDSKIVGRYQSLMNAGITVPPFITELTGITNSMVRSAPPSSQVMQEVLEFLGPLPVVAHNASFDEKFFQHECLLAGKASANQFACSMLVSRRLFPTSPNHKLDTLVRTLDITRTGDFHRALPDAEMTAELLVKIGEHLRNEYGINYPTHELLRKLQKTKYSDVRKTLNKFSRTNENEINTVGLDTKYPTFIRSNFDRQNNPDKRRAALPNPDIPIEPTLGNQQEKRFPVFWIVVAVIALLYVLFVKVTFARGYEELRSLLLPLCFHGRDGVIIARIKKPVTI